MSRSVQIKTEEKLDKLARVLSSSRIPTARPPLREVQNSIITKSISTKKLLDNEAATKTIETTNKSVECRSIALQTSLSDESICKKQKNDVSNKAEVVFKNPFKLRSNKVDVVRNKRELSNSEQVIGKRLCLIQENSDKLRKAFKNQTYHLNFDDFNPNNGYNNSLSAIALSPIVSSENVDSKQLLARFAQEPARKTTLIRAKRLRNERKDEIFNEFSQLFFNSEYFQENIEESFRIDKLYIGRRYFLTIHNPELTTRERAKILNWILTITDEIQLNHHVYYKVVRLFDNIIENMPVPKNMLQLVVIVTCWILMKMHETYVPRLKKIRYLCANVYSNEEFLQMERKILAYTKFNLRLSTPTDFFVFHLHADVGEMELLKHCVNFILVNFSLDTRFSMFSSCELATGAAYLASNYLQIKLNSEFILKSLESVREIVFLMDVQMYKMYSSNELKEEEFTVCKKYADEKHKKISSRLHAIFKRRKEEEAGGVKCFYFN